MSQKIANSDLQWSRMGLPGVYCRSAAHNNRNKPDLSRFYMRKAMKFYNQYVIPRSAFLRYFNWMVKPLIRHIMTKSMKSFSRNWTKYR